VYSSLKDLGIDGKGLETELGCNARHYRPPEEFVATESHKADDRSKRPCLLGPYARGLLASSLGVVGFVADVVVLFFCCAIYISS